MKTKTNRQAWPNKIGRANGDESFTLDIAGTTNSSEKVAARLIGAVACVGFGTYLLLHVETSWSAQTSDLVAWIWIAAVISFIIAALLPYNGHTYLDFADRQVVTLKHYAWFETSKCCRPLTDFSTIVVRHLCIPGGEGPDTYTGSVGLKPVDGKAVLRVKSFPTTQDEVPLTAYEFARKLQEMTGLPGAPGGELKTRRTEIESMTLDWPNKIARANRRHASLLKAGWQFEGALCAPPSLSAATAHL